MNAKPFDITTDVAWCPGCGDYGLRNIMLDVLADLHLNSENLCFVSGIGQAAKSPQYYDVNYFNGLHGRALPAAVGIKAANPDMKLIVQSGDGDIYGEGGNHLIHTIRRNPDMTVIVHDNMVYGLTKGQASPTSNQGMKTPIQTAGVSAFPFNPVALAITMGATFVARGSVGDKEKTKEVIKAAILHKGFALVDVFQACVSFNKINTHKWYKDNTGYIPEEHQKNDRLKALSLAFSEEPFFLGIFYQVEGIKIFEDFISVYENLHEPLYKRNRNMSVIKEIMDQKK
ncbi:MAG TPA: 2-oxoacid ferredoxin oxidoreductase [Lentisphaeria bacterium]|nr:MAG: 2-oxoacid ferredoxin oxidoreductase [Lentisphaerae bacterium GWF2_38_69]HBM17323.1 2-oxoacid ferredoxin oxidoreductase [Lentisphaeria bacterium]